MPQNNEGKACDGVLRLLEARTGLERANILHPEKDGSGPPVDLRFMLGAYDYALEHTLIEAFAGQIHMDNEFGQLIGPVIDELSGNLPGPAVYHLYCPINARVGNSARKLEQIRNDFIEWIRNHAQRLHERNPEEPTRDKWPHGICEDYQAKPPGFPYEVMLRREAHWSRSSMHYGVLQPSRFAPENVEDKRADRLQKALDAKCPKLLRCKEEGARSVLILEDVDISLTNYVLIQDALENLLKEPINLPDEIYLVETSVATWEVRALKIGEDIFPEGVVQQFDEAELNDITSGEVGKV
jgi:hypothetical protein